VNKLLFGDNLGWLRNKDVFPDESVDLVYLDPPFDSVKAFVKTLVNLVWTDAKEPGAFCKTSD
jgi:16S rRNA G966 N2-methylase RsmD